MKFFQYGAILSFAFVEDFSNFSKMTMLPGAGSTGMGNSPTSPGSPQMGQAPAMQTRMGQAAGGQSQGTQYMVGGGVQSPTSGQGNQTGAAGMQNTGAASGGSLPPNYRPGRP